MTREEVLERPAFLPPLVLAIMQEVERSQVLRQPMAELMLGFEKLLLRCRRPQPKVESSIGELLDRRDRSLQPVADLPHPIRLAVTIEPPPASRHLPRSSGVSGRS